MTDLTQAVVAAKAFLADTISDLDDVQVEEVEIGDGPTCWITLSYLRPTRDRVRDPAGPFADLGKSITEVFGEATRYERVYRRFEVVDGDVVSMTIREFASV